MQGFNVREWDVDRYDGANPVNISETTGTTTVLVSRNNLASGTYGLGFCDIKEVNFNSDYRDDFNNDHDLFNLVAAHEMGHAIGIDHVHRNDSLGGDDSSLMNSCPVWNRGHLPSDTGRSCCDAGSDRCDERIEVRHGQLEF